MNHLRKLDFFNFCFSGTTLLMILLHLLHNNYGVWPKCQGKSSGGTGIKIGGGGKQGRSQPHSPGWARVSTFLIFPPNLDYFFLFFSSNFSHFPSSFWLSGWATRPPGKALATLLGARENFRGNRKVKKKNCMQSVQKNCYLCHFYVEMVKFGLILTHLKIIFGEKYFFWENAPMPPFSATTGKKRFALWA